MTRVIIFGTGDIAQIANYYFAKDSPFEVIAFTVDSAYRKEDTFEDKPVVPFDTLERSFSPSEYKLFIALSYSRMNALRAEKFYQAKEKGYDLVTYVSSRCTYLSPFRPGENCFIFEDNTIQPFVKIGNNVTIWSGNHIGHHSEIHDHNFISSHVVLSGHAVVQSYCFLGVNSSVAHRVVIAEKTLIGAGAVVTKNTDPGDVYVPPRSIKLEKKSDSFNL